MKSSAPIGHHQLPATPAPVKATRAITSDAKTIPAQATPLGEHFYLFRNSSGQPQKKLIITAHGAYLPGMKLGVPSNTKLTFYAPHGQSLQDPSLGAVAQEKIASFETKQPGEQICNYALSKYAEDTYANIRYTVNNSDYDVLTLRNRKTPSLVLENAALTLEDAFKALKNEGLEYEEVHASFCRNFMFAAKPDIYIPTLRSTPETFTPGHPNTAPAAYAPRLSTIDKPSPSTSQACEILDAYYATQKKPIAQKFSDVIEHLSQLDQDARAHPQQWYEILSTGGLFEKQTWQRYSQYLSALLPTNNNEAIRLMAPAITAPLHFAIDAARRALEAGKLSPETAINLIFTSSPESLAPAHAIAALRNLHPLLPLAEQLYVDLPAHILRQTPASERKAVTKRLENAFNQHLPGLNNLAQTLYKDSPFGIHNAYAHLKKQMKHETGLQLSRSLLGKISLKVQAPTETEALHGEAHKGLRPTVPLSFRSQFENNARQTIPLIEQKRDQLRRASSAMEHADLQMHQREIEAQKAKKQFNLEAVALREYGNLSARYAYEKTLERRSQEEAAKQSTIANRQAQTQDNYERARAAAGTQWAQVIAGLSNPGPEHPQSNQGTHSATHSHVMEVARPASSLSRSPSLASLQSTTSSHASLNARLQSIRDYHARSRQETINLLAQVPKTEHGPHSNNQHRNTDERINRTLDVLDLYRT